jgi:toxin ParE1/3/4
MPFEVLLTADAVRDLEQIVGWIAEHDAPARAERVLERIDAAIAGLARFPARGAHARELLALGIREYRETFFKPYRVIYFFGAESFAPLSGVALGFGTIVIASGAGLSPVRTTQTVNTIDGMMKTASAITMRQGSASFSARK